MVTGLLGEEGVGIGVLGVVTMEVKWGKLLMWDSDFFLNDVRKCIKCEEYLIVSNET